MIGKNISGMPYVYGNHDSNTGLLVGKVIDKIRVPFKHELEVVMVDAYLVHTKEGYVFVVLPMNVQTLH